MREEGGPDQYGGDGGSCICFEGRTNRIYCWEELEMGEGEVKDGSKDFSLEVSCCFWVQEGSRWCVWTL